LSRGTVSVTLYTMRTRKKFQKYLFSSVILLPILLSIIILTDPTQPLHVWNVSFSPLILFLSALFLFIFCISSYLLLNKRRGLLVAIFLTSVLTLRYLGFQSIFYLIVLFAILILLEIFFSR